MLLQAVGVLTVSAIIRADRRLHVGDVPRFGTKHAQIGGGVVRARAHLGIVRLPDHAALLGPKPLKRHNDGLKVKRLVHRCSKKGVYYFEIRKRFLK